MKRQYPSADHISTAEWLACGVLAGVGLVLLWLFIDTVRQWL